MPLEKILTLDNVIIHIKSVLDKDKNHYYHEIFLEKCSYQRFGDRNSKIKVLCFKKPIKIYWDVNVDDIVIWKLVKTKTSSKYMIGIKIYKAIRPLVLKMPKMRGYVKPFKVKEGDRDKDNKLMSFRKDH